jgi:hypothetical protein
MVTARRKMVVWRFASGRLDRRAAIKAEDEKEPGATSRINRPAADLVCDADL